MTHEPPDADPTRPAPQPSPDPSTAPGGPYLGYRSALDEKRQLPAAVQAVIGFVVTGLTSAGCNFAGGFLTLNFGRDQLPQRLLITIIVAGVPLLIFGGMGEQMRRRGTWPAFLPGALAGWGAAALLEGICFIGLSG